VLVSPVQLHRGFVSADPKGETDNALTLWMPDGGVYIPPTAKEKSTGRDKEAMNNAGEHHTAIAERVEKTKKTNKKPRIYYVSNTCVHADIRRYIHRYIRIYIHRYICKYTWTYT
jgi:hypothetical protein